MQLVHKAKNFCMHNEQYSLTQQIKKNFYGYFLTHPYIYCHVYNQIYIG
jgi:hypothetical protein